MCTNRDIEENFGQAQGVTDNEGHLKEELLFIAALKHTASAPRLDINVVNMLIDGILYEHTNYTTYDSQHLLVIPAADHVYFDELP